jgi:hypothetical protein
MSGPAEHEPHIKIEEEDYEDQRRDQDDQIESSAKLLGRKERALSDFDDAAASGVHLIDAKPATPDQKILALLQQSLLPFSDRLDPFAALPVNLDRFEEHLVSFYLLY